MNIRRLFLLLIYITIPVSVQAEPAIEIIQVQNRPASEIEPLLLPLLEPSDQVVVNGQNLILKTESERVAIVKNLARQLDAPVNNLIITVVQSRDLTASELNAGMAGHVQFGSNAGGQANGYFNQYQGRSNLNNTQTIRTMEGAPAHIRAGNAYPAPSYPAHPAYPGYGSGPAPLVEATTGFAVTPRLAGNQAIIEVSPWSNRFNEYGQLEVQGAETTLRANLGEWVEIGGIDQSGQTHGMGITNYDSSSGQSHIKILIKVEKTY